MDLFLLRVLIESNKTIYIHNISKINVILFIIYEILSHLFLFYL